MDAMLVEKNNAVKMPTYNNMNGERDRKCIRSTNYILIHLLNSKFNFKFAQKPLNSDTPVDTHSHIDNDLHDMNMNGAVHKRRTTNDTRERAFKKLRISNVRTVRLCCSHLFDPSSVVHSSMRSVYRCLAYSL